MIIRLRSLAFAFSACAVWIAAASAQDATPSSEPPLFSRPFADADFETLSAFRLGNAVFRQEWTSAGEGASHFDGLGPLYNARSCAGCHIDDGRGRPPSAGGGGYDTASMLVKLSRLSGNSIQPPTADPEYGYQLQDFAVDGHMAEGRIRVDYADRVFAFPGGRTVRLREPRYSIEALKGGPIDSRTVLSARIAPQMIGLGLIARIPEADIRGGEDADDSDGDGISGRVNLVESGALGRPALGRFGWKAGQATLEDQISLAFSRDMGIATPLYQAGFGDCTPAQTGCRQAPDGRSPEFENLEAHSVIVGWAVRYSENLSVPAPRDQTDPRVQAGGRLFAKVGCVDCHRPAFTTNADPDQPHLGGRDVRAYTDLLLHDMGEGLADRLAEGKANGSEWRTAPLWGVGLAGLANGNEVFLHDGRARSITEAIVWHGGEALSSRDAFAGLSSADRDRLIEFVASL